MQNDQIDELLESVTRRRSMPDGYHFDPSDQLLLDQKLDALSDRLVAIAQDLYELALLLRRVTRP